jgi:hypothetical protein
MPNKLYANTGRITIKYINDYDFFLDYLMTKSGGGVSNNVGA